MEINTERLLLRAFRYDDDEDMMRYWVSDPAIQHMYSEPVYATKHEVKGLLKKYITSYERDDYYRWAIIEKASGVCIGQIAIYLVDNRNHACEIEYCVGGAFQKKGYCTEAAQAVIDYAFANINIHKMQVGHRENNFASRGVIEKCGFVYEATLRDYYHTDGRYVNRRYYSMLRGEWERLREAQIFGADTQYATGEIPA
jgi:ribosomal-protein-alanine N-acetyltransferase